MLVLYNHGTNILALSIPMVIFFTAMLLFFMHGISEKTLLSFVATMITVAVTTDVYKRQHITRAHRFHDAAHFAGVADNIDPVSYTHLERIDGKSASTFYFDTLEAAKEWYTGVQIEFNGTRYDVTFEWVKDDGLVFGRNHYMGNVVCPELEKEFSYPGHVSAFVTPN